MISCYYGITTFCFVHYHDHNNNNTNLEINLIIIGTCCSTQTTPYSHKKIPKAARRPSGP